MENEVGVNSEQSMSNIRVVGRNWNAFEEETLLIIENASVGNISAGPYSKRSRLAQLTTK
jgi:hypothetical protein